MSDIRYFENNNFLTTRFARGPRGAQRREEKEIVYVAFEFISHLFKQMCYWCKQDKEGVTPLLVAIAKKSNKVFDELLALNVELTQSDKKGNSLAFATVYFNNVYALGKLIEKGVLLNEKLPNGSNLLIEAAEFGYYDIAEILIKNGIDCNLKDSNGADPYIKNLEGINSFNQAENDGSRYIVSLLKNRKSFNGSREN